MSCRLKVIPGVADGSRLEYFCSGNSEAFDVVAQLRCENGDHDETWPHEDIVLPHKKVKILSSACRSYAIDATVAILSSDATTVTVMVRIIPPGQPPTSHNVCVVAGKNGTVEFPRALILMG
jgi:hypothetical protein